MPFTPANIWTTLRAEAAALHEPALQDLLEQAIRSAPDLAEATRRIVSLRLGIATDTVQGLEAGVIARDLSSVMTHDPAAHDVLTPFLFFKGFHALQAHRLSHALWHAGRRHMAYALQNRISVVCGVDIHPAARMGAGIMMDHATGIVIGETAEVGDDVLFWHGVTLGGRGTAGGDRHPKVGNNVMLGAQSTLLGNIRIGDGAKIAANSVVLHDVPAGKTVKGPEAT